jgi:septal ring factor EnvC (AmiA/AmiB activator)
LAEQHVRRSLTAWQRDYARLENQYNRQQKLLQELQEQSRTTKKSKAQAVKAATRQERERKTAEDQRIRKAGALTAKATTAASTAVVGYYLVAEELELWIVSETFTKSEWFQAVLTSIVAWLLAQGYSMVYRR